jgi:hypothetical protein
VKALAFLAMIFLMDIAYVAFIADAAWQIWSAGLRWEAGVLVAALLGVSWNLLSLQRKSLVGR